MMNAPIRDWHGVRVWIVGSSTGIGAQTAQLLLARGARVTITARSREKLDKVAPAQERLLIAPADVTDPATLAQAHRAACAQWGDVDLTLIVAGTHDDMRATDFDVRRARALFEVNVMGVFECVALVLPGLLSKPGGCGRGIAIVGSVAAYSGLPRALTYGASKAAILNFTESLYFDLHPHGVGVYIVSPGFVDTPLTESNTFPMPALMSARDAAIALVFGLERGDFDIHFPKRFTRTLKLLRLLPYRLYFALIRLITGL
jgi:short-subunit dehydrogenase